MESDDLGEEPTEEDLYAFGLDKMPSADEESDSAVLSYIKPSLSDSLIETASLVLHTAATRAGMICFIPFLLLFFSKCDRRIFREFRNFKKSEGYRKQL